MVRHLNFTMPVQKNNSLAYMFVERDEDDGGQVLEAGIYDKFNIW